MNIVNIINLVKKMEKWFELSFNREPKRKLFVLASQFFGFKSG